MEAAVRFPGDPDRFLLVDVTDQSVSLNQIHEWDRKALHYSPVARYTRLPIFTAFDYSKTHASTVALGLVSGSACLIQLREDDRPSETIATFKLKQQRKCNSIALSAQNWLAVALDKTRSDVCLNIFDANNDQNQDPIRKLCPAELVSSVRFFPNQPQELVLAAQRAYIRLYDLRDSYLSSNQSNIQATTRNVNNIAIDPLDENYFASAGSTNDPSVTVWDKRCIQSTSNNNSNGSVFDFRPAVDNSEGTTIWSLRYSGQKRGRLAICSSRGELRVIDMHEGQTTVLQPADYHSTNSQYGGALWTTNHYVSQNRIVERPISAAHDGSVHANRLLAFDWKPCQSRAVEQHILALRPNRKLNVIRVPHAIPHATVTARNDLSLAFADVFITETKPRKEPFDPHSLYDQQRNAEDFGPREYSGEVGRDGEDVKLVCGPDSPRLENLLATATIQHERCRQGYLFDCGRNAKIVSGNWQLERLWEIIERFRQQAADGGMVAEPLDLSFVGVTGICQEKIGNMSRRARSGSNPAVEDAISALSMSRELPSFEGARTDFPDHRQLSLELCGWKYHLDALEEECQELIARGLYYQAVVQAVLHDYKHVALNILRQLIRTKTLPNIGLGALLASDTINEEQKEMCRWMSADTEDPALKALLTFLATGDWRDVMKTNYLHLGYRVALALKYLNDTEIKGFLQTETARAIRNGDLEGLLLTGLGEQAMDLLQTYIAKTNDLQTAVLATAFTNPLYVDDVRWEMWKETYFMQMQSWRAFTERAQFVIQHSRIAITFDGRSMLEAPRTQVTLTCNHCQQPLARHDGRSMTQSRRPFPSNVNGTIILAASAGIVCTTCGRHMPRCGICKMWLGSPDPARAAGTASAQQLSNIMAAFLTFCVQCQHGFHADHARTWFSKHRTCPVPDCGCSCGIE